MFEISIEQIVKLLLPPFKRGIVTIKFIMASLKPLVDVYNSLMAYISETREKLSYSGQVIYLEYLLNKRFNNNGIGIYIADAYYDEVYLYNVSEDIDSLYLFNKSENNEAAIYNLSEYQSNPIDFIIYVPQYIFNDSLFELNALKSLVNYYIFSDKRYIVIRYMNQLEQDGFFDI